MSLRFYNKLLPYTLAIGLATAAAPTYGVVVVGDAPIEGNPQVVVGVPHSDTETSVTISRKQYVISWDYERRIPEWSAWILNKRLLGSVARSGDFRLDWDLDEALADEGRTSVGTNDYKGSCIDRGHQVASADRTATDNDNRSTFLMSNVMPQAAYMNRRTWVSLERFLRRQVLENDQHVQIYAGPIMGRRRPGIGPDKDILVPEWNYKIAVLMPASRDTPQRNQMRFFVANFPNVTSTGTNPVDDQEQACWDYNHTMVPDDSNHQAYWRGFVTGLKDVQAESGVSFDFLDGIHEMTADEVDQLISQDHQQTVTSKLPESVPVHH